MPSFVDPVRAPFLGVRGPSLGGVRQGDRHRGNLGSGVGSPLRIALTLSRSGGENARKIGDMGGGDAAASKAGRSEKWTCSCGEWSWGTRSKCFACGKGKPKKAKVGASEGRPKKPSAEAESQIQVVGGVHFVRVGSGKKGRAQAARVAAALVDDGGGDPSEALALVPGQPKGEASDERPGGGGEPYRTIPNHTEPY